MASQRIPKRIMNSDRNTYHLPPQDDGVTDEIQFIDWYCLVSSFSTALVTEYEISLTCFSVKVSRLSTG